MTDLRKAAEMALEALEEMSIVIDGELWARQINAKTKEALRQALAQPEQEPIAWVTFNAYGEEDDVWYENPEGKLLDGWTYKPLYTAPPNREWVGLTDEEILDEYRQCYGDDGTLTDCYFARAIIIRFKGKNGG